jgi:hypothetical protein
MRVIKSIINAMMIAATSICEEVLQMITTDCFLKDLGILSLDADFLINLRGFYNLDKLTSDFLLL